MAEAFSYEDIYELLHREKFSADLEAISASDIKKIREYLKSKRALLNSQEESTNIFSSQKRAKIQLELDNAMRALKDLLDKRERKIISRAIFSTRTNSALKDTTNILGCEEELYTTLLRLLPKNREDFFKLLEGTDKTAPEPPKAEELPEPKPKPQQEVHSPTEPAPAEPLTEEPQSRTEALPADEPSPEPEVRTEIDKAKVKFLEYIPEFVGPDLQKYGPYNPQDISEIPAEIAKLLIHQGKAEEITNTEDELSSEGDSSESPAPSEDEVPKTEEDVLSEVQGTHDTQTQTSEDQTQTEN